MKSALSEVIDSMDNFNAGVRSAFKNAAIDQSGKVMEVCIDEAWDSVCNTLFSTDKTIEQYVKMKCICEFNELIQSVIKELEKTYKKKKNTENAENYIESIDAMFAVASLSCDFAKNRR